MENGAKKKLNKNSLIAIILCAVIVFGIVSYDFISGRSSCEKTSVAMGTVVTVKLFGFGAKNDLDKIETEINGLENSVLSWRKEGSDVYRINKGSGTQVSVSPDTVKIIGQCIDISDDCGGVFDITIGNVTKLWDFGGNNQRLPSDDEIKTALGSVGYKNVSISGNAVQIKKGQSLDLGAVGKGFVCDKIKELLDKGRTKSAVVSVGGSLLIYGNRTFSVGIVNPDNDKQSMGTLKLKDTCVSTSGNYEKYFEQDGKRYHHILNAKTGYPATSEFKSVTVVCESGLISDALSTVCYIAGYRKSVEILKKFGAEAVFIFNNNAVRVTDGLSGKFTVTDDSYTLDK
ncbi:MAG TPA: FAD:protein FMN transferase [Oscillospiraceae bacterium]|nr:FAD:protein FMN transferase [Oscillospiraceae bacterium]